MRDFTQIAEKHFLYGCPSCAGNKRKTTEEIIVEFRKIHGDFYDYSLVNYTGYNNKVSISCPIHGQYYQTPHNHILGKKCKKCSIGNTSIIEHQWLDHLGLPNDDDHRNVHIKVGNRKFIVDGLIPGSNLIYEFLGDYWHGNPSVYDSTAFNKMVKRTFGDLYIDTVNKIRYLRSHGFKVICIWESKFNKVLRWKN